ncbi:DUF2219 domain-containing protein, partial [Vibrio alginolyticus]|nr:DUF2219 domain-containing protein [Vibrio alginolyticus]
MKLLRLLPLTLLCGPALASTQATLSMHLDNDGIFGV